MKKTFIEAVENHKLSRVRISLSNELLLDPRGKTFGEMLSFAMSRLPDLFEENEEANYSVPPQNEWSQDFIYIVKNDLDSNFSKEKLAFYETVAKHVGKDKAEEINTFEEQEKEKRLKDDEQDVTDNESSSGWTERIDKPHAIVTSCGATLMVVGIIAGKSMITIAGGTALVVGGILLLNDYIQNK